MFLHTITKRHGQLFSKLTFIFDYGFLTISRRVFLYNFILKVFISIYVKTPSHADGYFERYPIFTICCGCSEDIQKNASRSCRYDNYTLPNQFLRTLTVPYSNDV